MKGYVGSDSTGIRSTLQKPISTLGRCPKGPIRVPSFSNLRMGKFTGEYFKEQCNDFLLKSLFPNRQQNTGYTSKQTQTQRVCVQMR
eukprot:6183196-Pleurochrysis_carterae.AAC.4